jgi:hypothetical protein
VDLNPSKVIGPQKEMLHSQYNLIATVNNHPDRQNTCHYMALTKSQMSNFWYSHDNKNVHRKRFLNRNNDFVLNSFQESASFLFYVKETSDSVCSDNHHTNNGANDNMGSIIKESLPLHMCPTIKGISKVSTSGRLTSPDEVQMVKLDNDDLFSSSDELIYESMNYDAIPSTFTGNRNKFKEYLQQSKGQECTISHNVYNLHEIDLATFEGVETCQHIFFYIGKIDNLKKAENSFVRTATVKLQTWYAINGWSILGKPCVKR